MKTKIRESGHHFSYGEDMGLIGRGDSVEECFAYTAQAMFLCLSDVKQIRPLQILSFEFAEKNIAKALTTWLNLLLSKCQEHRLMLGDFRLKREGHWWKATVSGEPWRPDFHYSITLKQLSPSTLSIKKIGPTWEARCKLKWT